MLPKNRRNVFSHKNTYITQVIQAVIFNFIVFLTNIYAICCGYNKTVMVNICKKLKMERILENLFFLLFDTYIFCFQTSYAFSTSLSTTGEASPKTYTKKAGEPFLALPCWVMFVFVHFFFCGLLSQDQNPKYTVYPNSAASKGLMRVEMRTFPRR